MPYRTILVHVNDQRRIEALLGPAIELAVRYNAHLIGMHVYTSLPLPQLQLGVRGRPGGKEREVEELAAAFARSTDGRPFVAEWRAVKVDHADFAPIVIEHALAADLIVASQNDPDWPLSGLLDFPERLALESGRPVLVVPYVGRYPRVGRNVVIAWKRGREAARAVFDALPLLQGAEKVHILEVRERAGHGGDLADDTSIAAALARHGIKPSVRTSIAADISVGDEILSRLADLEADLLIMGAYGHSRMREMIFGGVTQHIAGHMTVPTLLSH
jgi:nucleotide-binding universal stress UspA family protein